MTFDSFCELAGSYSAVSVHRVAMADMLTPVSVFMKIRDAASYPFLFESVEGGEQLARYSFLGKNPYQVFSFKNNLCSLQKNEETTELKGGYYENLQKLLGSHTEPSLPDLPRLTGGAVGFSAYDTIRQTENLTNTPPDDLNLPEAIWSFYDEIYAFDHVKHRIVLIKTVFTTDLKTDEELRSAYDAAQESLSLMENELHKETRHQTPLSLLQQEMESNLSRERFYEMVEKAKSYIFEGDIFQVVLSQRFRSQYKGDRFMLYRALRMVNPSPYLFYLDFGAFSLIGSSPEVLVSVEQNVVKVLPIAGTRPRGSTEEQDNHLAQELAADTKEIAEHVMLVDLGRNDLSRVSEAGTVKVTRDRVIERYSHVMHIVSEVTGRLAHPSVHVDALQHCFPAGTVSGAPKVRAMEIIDELEPVKRGPYAGAVGYFDYSGNMDTCIAIRTMVATESDVYIQAGAGIVADSVAVNEFEETRNKAKALFEALKLAIKLQN
ncbi:MAG: anthranilate synthase component I [Balneolales bacterium]|nr:anthranilate synthase component I [Balneolales bacterium]